MNNCALCKRPYAIMLHVCVLGWDGDGIRYGYDSIGQICHACWSRIQSMECSAVPAPVMAPKRGPRVSRSAQEREGGKGYDWKVARIGNQQDGTYKIPKADSVPSPELTEPASVATASDVKGISSSCSQSIKPVPIVKPETEVQAHCFRLVDLTAATMKYAQQNGAGLVTRDDARAIALTVYIQAGRSGMLRRRPVERITRDARRAG